MDAAGLLYLEADDEVTSVVRRLRVATEGRVIIVVPGRSRATSSAVALRLLERIAAQEGREIAIVGDALTRSLAAEAGLIAYVTVDDARRAAPEDRASPATRQAGIHVVRGSGPLEETAPTLAAPALAYVNPRTDETVSVPSVRRVPPSHAPKSTRPRRRRGLGAAAAAALALLLTASVAAGAIFLPAATVTLVPETMAISERTYLIDVAGAERRAGVAEESATVSATGSYPIRTLATGVVTFYNWSSAAVDVPAKTYVVAEAEAFETLIPRVVPEGRLLPSGVIEAGQATVDVMASAPGPQANLPAGAINLVLDEGLRARLRGFVDNQRMLVENPGPTSGGSESPGFEIIQADVDAGVAELRSALLAEADRRIGAGDALSVPVGEIGEPAIGDVASLVGQRDQEQATIQGSMEYDRWLVDRDELERAALRRLRQDSAALPSGHRLLDDETRVEIGEATGTDQGVQVTVTVTGRAVSEVDVASVLERIRGLPRDEAAAALDGLADARIDLWPGWVSAVPEMDWRIDVRIDGAEPGPVPSGSP